MSNDAGIDPRLVPTTTLADGTVLPMIGLGTFGSDHVPGPAVADAVRGAIRAGYRLIDCAACYGNEALIGQVLADLISSGEVAREDLRIISKVWNDSHAPEAVAASARKSLTDLRLDRLDLYLVHWPFPNHHAPFASPEDRNPDSRPYLHEEFMATWRAMERLVDEGLVRAIGVSNVTIPKLDLVLRDARIAPVVAEMELHPSFQQGELFQYCLDHRIQPIGYSPLGSPARPERDRTDDDVDDLSMDVVRAIAQEHGIHPAEVALKWAVQRGQIPIPFSATPRNYLSNLRAVTTDPLTPAQMDAMRSAERNCRLIKGQVFCWPGSAGWLDLWDVDGTIPGWHGYESHPPSGV